MQEKGSMEQLLNKYAPAPQFCPDLTGQALGFNSCISAFLVFVSGTATGLILLTLELISKKSASNWAWLEWYGKDSEVKQSSTTQDKSTGIEKDQIDAWQAQKAKGPGPLSSTHARIQAGENQQTAIVDIEIQG